MGNGHSFKIVNCFVEKQKTLEILPKDALFRKGTMRYFKKERG